MDKKVFAVVKSYVNATMLSRLLPWEQMGLSLTLEYTPISAADKIVTFRPDLLILPEGLLHVNVQALVQTARKANPNVQVILLREGAAPDSPGDDPAIQYLSSLTAETMRAAVEKACVECAPATASGQAGIFSLPEGIEANGDLRILRFMEVHPDREAALARLRGALGDQCLACAFDEKGRLSALFNDSEVEEAGVLFSSAHMLYQLLNGALAALSTGRHGCVLVSDRVSRGQLEKENARLNELEAYLYLLPDVPILSWSLLESRRHPFDYALAEQKTNPLFVAVVSGNKIEAVRLVEELLLKLTLASMSFEGLAFCRMRLAEQYQLAAGIFCADPPQADAPYPTEAFASLQAESDAICACFGALADHFLPRKVHAKVVQSLLAVGERYAEIVSLSDIARELSITSTYLSRVFKEDIGVRFVDYLNRVRIFKSRELIVTGECNVGRLSEKVGFIDAKYFTRVFKRYTHLTPTQYIEMCAGQPKETNP